MITKIRKNTLIIVILVLSIVSSLYNVRIGSEAFIAYGHIAQVAFIRYLVSFILGVIALLINGIYVALIFKLNKNEKIKNILDIIFLSVLFAIVIASLIVHIDMNIRIINEYLGFINDPSIPLDAVNSYKRSIIIQILEMGLIVIHSIMLTITYILFILKK